MDCMKMALGSREDGGAVQQGAKDGKEFGKKQVPFSMDIGNVQLMHECFAKHSSIGTARMK